MNYGTRTSEEWRVAVAEKVLGWRTQNDGGLYWDDCNNKPRMIRGGLLDCLRQKMQLGPDMPGGGFCFAPDISADDDMLALAVVKQWTEDLRDQWADALVIVRDGRPGEPYDEERYQPGDWSAAVLAVVDGKETT